MQKLSNKQKPQLIMLIVLSVVVFGYFSFRMITPTPAAAHSQLASVTSPKSAAATVSVASVTNAAPDTKDPSLAVADAPPPSETMRDPFIPGILDPSTITAYNNARKSAAEDAKKQNGKTTTVTHGSPATTPSALNLPQVQPLPGPGSVSAVPSSPTGNTSGPSGIAALPVPAPAPAWSVTGVLRSGSDEVAILQNGNTRRIVKVGDQVDSQYRIVSVTRQSVVLRHGQQTVTLPLGATAPSSKDSSSAATPSPSSQTPRPGQLP